MITSADPVNRPGHDVAHLTAPPAIKKLADDGARSS